MTCCDKNKTISRVLINYWRTIKPRFQLQV